MKAHPLVCTCNAIIPETNPRMTIIKGYKKNGQPKTIEVIKCTNPVHEHAPGSEWNIVKLAAQRGKPGKHSKKSGRGSDKTPHNLRKSTQ